MSASFHRTQSRSLIPGRHSVLELTVNNHPGVISHVCSLFSRRAYKMEGIFWLPGCEKESRVWLLVNAERSLDKLIKHVEKLEDVRDVRNCDVDSEVFAQLEKLFASDSTQD